MHILPARYLSLLSFLNSSVYRRHIQFSWQRCLLFIRLLLLRRPSFVLVKHDRATLHVCFHMKLIIAVPYRGFECMNDIGLGRLQTFLNSVVTDPAQITELQQQHPHGFGLNRDDC